jgi:hypothetical protein
MGGFMEYEGNRPIRVLLPKELESYSLTGNGDFPRISKMEIQDKSKGDFISKSVVILQASWFVMQCIARHIQGLPITELELATIAFASLNFAIYVLWWDKPLNVQCGVRVYKKRSTDSLVDDGHVDATAGFWIAIRDALSVLPAAIVQGPLPEKRGPSKWTWPFRVLGWTVAKPLEIMFGGDYDRVGKRIYTFYPRDWKEHWTDRWALSIVIVAIASAFGGIHCIGWSFTFPSSTDRTLWRVASISITSIPITLFLFIFVLESDSLGDIRNWFSYHVSEERISLIGLPFILQYFLSFFVYVLSRLVLLILTFLTLRSLPPAAYHTVHWTSFIPHI